MKPEPNSTLTTLSDDVLLTIFQTLESDPRNWARLACVCTRFSLLIRTVLFPLKCSSSLPSVANDLIGSNATCTLDGWASLYKLAVCCPGLLHSGVLLEHSDFGLEREGGFYGVGTDEAHVGCSSSSALVVEDFGLEREVGPDGVGLEGHVGCSSSSALMVEGQGFEGNPERTPLLVSETDSSTWSLYDDLYFDTVYNASETLEIPEEPENRNISTNPGGQFTVNKRRKTRSPRSHLASGVWNLSREQGNKLLASRFRDDCLYICDWPGCIHIEEKRNYMLFRGVFKNFKKSRVWRTINDGNRSRINLNCAFCTCNQTWDLHSAFCLRRVFGYHDDGEPVVRAYVCENGHVSGAWTDWPLYT